MKKKNKFKFMNKKFKEKKIYFNWNQNNKKETMKQNMKDLENNQKTSKSYK